MAMKLSASWNPRALVRIRPIDALFDSAIPLVSFHSMVARGRAPVGAHLLIGGDHVHPVLRVLQWSPCAVPAGAPSSSHPGVGGRQPVAPLRRRDEAEGGAAGVHFSTQSGLRHARRRRRRKNLEEDPAWLSIRRQDVRRR
jgi:hypothetical protein